VQIVPTDTGIDQRRIREGRSIRGLGEQAAVDLLGLYLLVNPDAQALLLFEDTDIERQRHERISFISTGDFLHELEAARLIQSTDYILDEATAQGRNIERQRRALENSTTRQRFREQLTQQPPSFAERYGTPPTAKNPQRPAGADVIVRSPKPRRLDDFRPWTPRLGAGVLTKCYTLHLR
jgi:hypothetical protein